MQLRPVVVLGILLHKRPRFKSLKKAVHAFLTTSLPNYAMRSSLESSWRKKSIGLFLLTGGLTVVWLAWSVKLRVALQPEMSSSIAAT
jgi:hypothetical protein